MSAPEYACENDDLFKLIVDPGWFCPFIKYQFAEVSFAGSSLVPQLSHYNLTEALASYVSDMGDLERRELRGGEAEQIKKAAFVAYWLRRVSPIQGIMGPAEVFSGGGGSQFQQFLTAYGNEYAAFDLGFRISRYFVTRDEDRLTHTVRLTTEHDGILTDINFSNIGAFTLDLGYLRDVCQLMKEKNVSPHALYLAYKGMFGFFR